MKKETNFNTNGEAIDLDRRSMFSHLGLAATIAIAAPILATVSTSVEASKEKGMEKKAEKDADRAARKAERDDSTVVDEPTR